MRQSASNALLRVGDSSSPAAKTTLQWVASNHRFASGSSIASIPTDSIPACARPVVLISDCQWLGLYLGNRRKQHISPSNQSWPKSGQEISCNRTTPFPLYNLTSQSREAVRRARLPGRDIGTARLGVPRLLARSNGRAALRASLTVSKHNAEPAMLSTHRVTALNDRYSNNQKRYEANSMDMRIGKPGGFVNASTDDHQY